LSINENDDDDDDDDASPEDNFVQMVLHQFRPDDLYKKLVRWNYSRLIS